MQHELIIPIEYLLPHKDDMEVAVHSLYNGRPSISKSPLLVYRSKEHDEKYVVSDGHHRLLQAIINGKGFIKCILQEGSVSSDHTIVLDEESDFYGLKETLENGWLISRL